MRLTRSRLAKRHAESVVRLARALVSTAIPAALVLGCSGESPGGVAASSTSPAASAGASGPEAGGDGVAVVRHRRTERPPTLAEELAANVDPARDGWSSEVLSAAAGRRLKELAHALEAPESNGGGSLDDFASADYSGPALRPSPLEEAFSDGVFRVRRWRSEGAAAAGGDHRGPSGFESSLRELVDSGDVGGELRLAFKAVEIEERGESFSTRVVVGTDRRGSSRALQQNALWSVEWSYPETGPDESPNAGSAGKAFRIRSIEVERYEEVRIDAPGGGVLFGDGTRAALGHNEAYELQVVPGINDWLGRVSLIAGMSIVGHHGFAVGDADGDGLEDLYVCDAAGLPNRLYLQNPDGTATDAGDTAGVDWLEASSSALFVDLDNDGDQDLVVAFERHLLVHENDGGGRFRVRAEHRDIVTSSSSLSAADYDEDGNLDLFVCGYDGDPDNRGLPGPVPYNDARNGAANVLLRNRGEFQFEDVTAASGLDENNRRFSFASAWDDYDGDGDLDLYVANDFGRNNLYRNRGAGARPRFADVAAEVGAEDVAAGMSAAWGDFNRDGRPDMYVSNMFSSAGGRIAGKGRFATAAPETTVRELRRMARGNTLFENVGGRFRDVSEEVGVTLGRWAWGSRFADLNNDSWPDLVVTNGYVTNEDTDDL